MEKRSVRSVTVDWILPGLLPEVRREVQRRPEPMIPTVTHTPSDRLQATAEGGCPCGGWTGLAPGTERATPDYQSGYRQRRDVGPAHPMHAAACHRISICEEVPYG